MSVRFAHVVAPGPQTPMLTARIDEKQQQNIESGRRELGSTGAIMMSFFATVFCVVGLGPLIGWTNPFLLLPLAILGFIVVRVVALSQKGSASLRTARAGKVIMWSSIGEGIGIVIVVNIVQSLGQPKLILPGIAAVVGLHFLPMAHAIPFRPFYAVAATLLIVATVGTLLRQTIGSEVTGIGAAAALWIASFAALRRQTQALASQL